MMAEQGIEHQGAVAPYLAGRRGHELKPLQYLEIIVLYKPNDGPKASGDS